MKKLLESLSVKDILFGENKVQEAQKKFQNISNPNVDLHLIDPCKQTKQVSFKYFQLYSKC